jgi:membrane associated rhomboid family serine protease
MTNYRPGNPQSLPPVVKNIIIINVIMVLLQFALGKAGINLGDYLGLHYWASPLFKWWQPLTHIFMHGDPYDVQGTLMHIGFNMLALWMFGRVLENMWGPRKFLIFYLVCGIGAAICHMGVLTFEYTRYYNDFLAYQAHPGYEQFLLFARHHSLNIDLASLPHPFDIEQARATVELLFNNYSQMINEATVGASGAVFGVLFAFAYLFPNVELLLIFPPIPVKAKWVVTVYALIELFSGIQNSAGDNVAHFAHLGGMLFAFLLLRIWNSKAGNRFY